MFYHRQTLCRTLCGNDCPLITISSPKYEYPNDSVLGRQKVVTLTVLCFNFKEDSEAGKESKKYVVITARVHPGESNSSWVMRGLLRHLSSNHPNAQVLRKKFIFKIIPMLNPDGVIHGR